jgi:NAD(P)-dependent dehydrogenase (short-subunit alcohol dehydrogenase family)
MKKLEGKVALVTGAARGISAAVAEQSLQQAGRATA